MCIIHLDLCDNGEKQGFQDPRTDHELADQYPYPDHVLVGNGTMASGSSQVREAYD